MSLREDVCYVGPPPPLPPPPHTILAGKAVSALRAQSKQCRSLYAPCTLLLSSPETKEREGTPHHTVLMLSNLLYANLSVLLPAV